MLTRVFLALALTVTAVAPVSADEYPNRQLRIVVPYTPGGFNDTLARTVGDHLSQDWKQPVVVDNRPGGNTIIGNEIVAKSAPDGYTLLITPLPFATLPSLYGAKLPYDTTKDFTPVIWAASTHNLLAFRAGLPFDTVRGLIDYARKNPGKLTYGSTGTGSSNHLSMELFEKMTGTTLTHVPYKGSAPAVLALMSGQIDVLFDNLPNLIQQVRAGKLKAVAVTGTARSPLLPAVPTVAESGVPGYDVTVWFGLQAPAGTPSAIVGKLNTEIASILHKREVAKAFAESGVEVVASTPARFAALLEVEIKKWSELVRDAHVKIE
jgi:tripartite-type tricarboxylate transporter receptor subunit TctC